MKISINIALLLIALIIDLLFYTTAQFNGVMVTSRKESDKKKRGKRKKLGTTFDNVSPAAIDKNNAAKSKRMGQLAMDIDASRSLIPLTSCFGDHRKWVHLRC
jgi:hypothetical protein